MRLHTDQEFNQNKISEINKQYNILHNNSKLNDEHAIGTEQKVCELKSRLRNFKRLIKKSKLKPNKALKKATNNMNMLPTRNYGVPLEKVEKKSLESEEYKLDFYRLKKVYKDVARYSRYDKKVDKRNKKILRSPLNVVEIAYLLYFRSKKKDTLSVFYKSTTDKKSFLNKDKRFVITCRFENHSGTELYRVQKKDTGKRVDSQFMRKELFALQSNVQPG